MEIEGPLTAGRKQLEDHPTQGEHDSNTLARKLRELRPFLSHHWLFFEILFLNVFFRDTIFGKNFFGLG